jgi:ADP-ribose pyrophosphatase YjhB (NUDIX family)
MSSPEGETEAEYLRRKREYRGPSPTVDVICVREGKVLLIERRNPPHGWALPGGFIDYGEAAETAAVREVQEEVQLDVELDRQFHTYSAPDRDPRQHTLSVVFVAKPLSPDAEPQAADDAAGCAFFGPDELPDLAFDHAQVLEDFFSGRY